LRVVATIRGYPFDIITVFEIIRLSFMVKLIINPIKTRRGFIMKKILILSMSLLAIGQSFAADGITGLAGKAKDGAIENAGKAAGFVGEQAGKAANYVGEQAGKGAGYVAGELGKAKTFAGEQAEAGKKALVAGYEAVIKYAEENPERTALVAAVTVIAGFVALNMYAKSKARKAARKAYNERLGYRY